MNIRTMPKMLLVIIGLFVFLIVLFVLTLFMIPKTVDDPKTTPTPSSGNSIPTSTPRPVAPTIDPNAPSPTLLPVVDTGATDEIDPLPPEESKVVNLQFELRQQLPIETPEFTLDYNHADSYFIVFLNEPYQESINAFSAWLSQNGYSDIPEEAFIFETQ